LKLHNSSCGKFLERIETLLTSQDWHLRVQLLKLGVLYGLPQLSEYYVIWDFDMAPVRHIPILYGPEGWQKLGQGAPSEGTLATLRMAVNIGGARSEGYDAAYNTLFGKEYGSVSI
jgi:hypothetical protein